MRLAVSPDGSRAYVTARKDNAVLVFDTSKFALDSAHAKIAEIGVGTAPVPVAVLDAGNTIMVGNSNRFSGRQSKPESITIIDGQSNRVLGAIPAGSFPRDIVDSPDHQTRNIANFGSNTIDVWGRMHLAR